MKCPFCGELDNKVIDSRVSKDGSVIRRRRECIDCTRRFTTYEHIEEIPDHDHQKGWSREVFNREKVGVRYPQGLPETGHQHECHRGIYR
jgi:transcriptional repressor NrdR